MSSVGKSLYYLLANSAGVTAIVGSNPKRIYPNVMPQDRNYPAITYTQITNVPTNQKDASSGFDQVDFDVDCWSKTYSEVSTLAAAVRSALDFQSITTQGDNVNRIRFVREVDLFDQAAQVYHKTMQFRFIVIR